MDEFGVSPFIWRAGTFDPFVRWVQPTGLTLSAVGCTHPTLTPSLPSEECSRGWADAERAWY
jgi:hypothetical protein